MNTQHPAERILMGPGPSPVPARVLRALGAPTLGHLDPQYLSILDEKPPGRMPIRTGAMQSVPAGLPQGLIPWEITLAQLIAGQGYATGIYGKWHLGDREGRYPKDRGFDEWYGIPRTTNESMFTSTPGYDPKVTPLPYVLEARAGEVPREAAIYDLEMRRRFGRGGPIGTGYR